MANGRRRGRGGLLLGIIVVLGLAWTGYWYAAHYFAGKVIARVTSTPINGGRIACTGINLGGFPLRLDFRCARGTYAEGERVTAALGGIAASAPLYWPGSVEATIVAPLTLNLPDRGVALTATWSAAKATGSAGLNGISGGSASFVSLKIENGGPLPGFGVESIAADTAGASIASASDAAYAVEASAKNLLLNRAAGTALPALDADIRATALNVGPLGTDPARALLAWLRGRPGATIEKLRIATAGAILSASGNLALSPDGLLNGAILLRYNGIDALANLIETLRPGTRDRFELALQGLAAMSQPATTEDGAMMQTTLTFTNGTVWLTVFPLPIDPIPPIRF